MPRPIGTIRDLIGLRLFLFASSQRVSFRQPHTWADWRMTAGSAPRTTIQHTWMRRLALVLQAASASTKRSREDQSLRTRQAGASTTCPPFLSQCCVLAIGPLDFVLNGVSGAEIEDWTGAVTVISFDDLQRSNHTTSSIGVPKTARRLTPPGSENSPWFSFAHYRTGPSSSKPLASCNLRDQRRSDVQACRSSFMADMHPALSLPFSAHSLASRPPRQLAACLCGLSFIHSFVNSDQVIIAILLSHLCLPLYSLCAPLHAHLSASRSQLLVSSTFLHPPSRLLKV